MYTYIYTHSYLRSWYAILDQVLESQTLQGFKGFKAILFEASFEFVVVVGAFEAMGEQELFHRRHARHGRYFRKGVAPGVNFLCDFAVLGCLVPHLYEVVILDVFQTVLAGEPLLQKAAQVTEKVQLVQKVKNKLQPRRVNTRIDGVHD